MKFIEKLDKLLKEKKWSVGRLATESGVPYSTLKTLFQAAEQGKKRLPSYENAVAICQALGVPADYFSDCEDVVIPKPKKKETTEKPEKKGKSE